MTAPSGRDSDPGVETALDPVPEWQSPSDDPNDETFGDVIASDDRGDLGSLPERLADLDPADVVLVGEPFDAAVVGRSGAAEGPTAIRNSLAGVKTHHVEAGPIREGVRIVDLGDVTLRTGDDVSDDGGEPVDDGKPDDTEADDEAGGVPGNHTADDEMGSATADRDTAAGQDAAVRDAAASQSTAPGQDPATVQNAVADVAAIVHDADAFPVFLGGDNSLTSGNVRPLLDRGSVGIVNFDAHLDVREVRDGPTSGTPYRQLFDAGLDAYVCVGARHFETSTEYVDYVHDRGDRIVTAETIDRDIDEALERVWRAVDDVDHLYVSIDCDVLDAPVAPGVSAPTPGGLRSRELFRLVRRVAADGRVAGLEVVECAPPLDVGKRTSDVAARTIVQFLTRYVEGHGGNWR